MSPNIKDLRFSKSYRTHCLAELPSTDYKFVTTELDNKLKELTKIETGLNDDETEVLVRVLTRAKLSAARFQTLMHCVLPQATVQDKHVRMVVVWLLMNYTSVPFKQSTAVLQWLVVLLENDLANRHMIDSFYHQFYFLIARREYLARWTCKILYLLTTPDDITREKVVTLWRYRHKMSRGPHIDALLGLFKSFRPELVPERIPTVNAFTAFGRIPNKLLETVNKLSIHHAGVRDPRREINLHVDAELTALDDETFSSESEYDIQKVKRKKKKDSLIPPPVYAFFGSKHYREGGELTVQYFRSLEALSCFQLTVETPSLSLSLLQSSLGRHMLTFDHNTVLVRFSYQLHHLLDQVFLTCRRTSQPEEKRRVLKSLAALQDYAHDPLPVVSLFVKDFLFLWGGGLFLNLVLKLMHWLHFSSHTELQCDYLTPLYTLFISSAVKVKCLIIRTLAQLFSNLMVARYYHECPGLFSHVTAGWHAEKTFICILKSASYMFSQGFSQAESTTVLLPEVLRFYEKVLTAIEVTDTKLCVSLPPCLLAATLSSYDATVLSRTCQLLMRCTSAVKERPPSMFQQYFKEVSHTLRQHNAEMQHTLKGQVFPAADGIFCNWLTGAQLKGISANPIALEITHHPAIISVVWSILHQQSAAPDVSQQEVDILSALRNHLPHIYNYLIKFQ